MQLIAKYFPDLDQRQRDQFAALEGLYRDWNAKINVISRRDIDNLYPNHVLHSLVIARMLPYMPGARFMDLGTGGGFPGIPLAILWPECQFHLIDRIGKKLRVVEDVAKQIGLTNVTVQHGDVGECHQDFNYVVSRAVMPLNELVPLVRKNIAKRNINPSFPNGLICLKGGDLTTETRGINYPIIEYSVQELIPEDNFATKMLVYVPMRP